jgi:hypothetical protein
MEQAAGTGGHASAQTSFKPTVLALISPTDIQRIVVLAWVIPGADQMSEEWRSRAMLVCAPPSH